MTSNTLEEPMSLANPNDDSEDQVEDEEEVNQVEEQEGQDKGDEEGEHEQYSARVQKRINELVGRAKSAEEQNNRLSQEKNDAYNYARGLMAEQQQSQNRNKTLEQGYVAELNQRLGAEGASLKDQLKSAYEGGDYDKVAEVTSMIAELGAQKVKAKSLSPANRPPPSQEAPQQMQQPQQSRPDPQALDWAGRNPWFGRDSVMTGAAQAVDHELVSRGIDPSSEFYYQEIDRIMRDEFPHKFDKSRPMTQSVAGVNRNPTSSKNKKITLTDSERGVARRLGVSDEQYMKSKSALQRNA
tara:strand:- start:8786 stop:9679 length:894 start_codon:yes stop_codon:yes gene_type:complete